MKSSKQLYFIAIFMLTVLVVISAVFVSMFTFAGNSEAPDAIVTYTKDHLSWNVGLDEDGIANLNIFGIPEEGEDYPTVDPSSGDTYRIRLKNNVSGNVNYFMYIYCNNPHDVPLKFEVAKTEDMQDNDKIPYKLEGKEIISSVKGKLGGNGLKDFEINWEWDSESDPYDTNLGDRAEIEELLYTVNVMLVIEDNNSYYSGNNGDGIVVVGGSNARLMHRAYIQGRPGEVFEPESNITRAEVAAIFARILANYNEDELVGMTSNFSDVKNDMWYTNYVSFLENKKIINGYSDGTFKPDNNMTIAEFSTVCIKYLEKTAGLINPESISFIDVSESHWAYKIIQKIASRKLVTGYPDKTFKPDNLITRAEAVAIVNRLLDRHADKDYINENKNSVRIFNDMTDKNHWAYYDVIEASNDHIKITKQNSEKWEGFQQ